MDCLSAGKCFPAANSSAVFELNPDLLNGCHQAFPDREFQCKRRSQPCRLNIQIAKPIIHSPGFHGLGSLIFLASSFGFGPFPQILA
jgi:hypothetical protein